MTSVIAAVLAFSSFAAAAPPPGQPGHAATWSLTGSLKVARGDQAAVLLESGEVLVVGGLDSGFTSLNSAEEYDPTTARWTRTGNLLMDTAGGGATLLPGGQVLVEGTCCSTASAELYTPATAAGP